MTGVTGEAEVTCILQNPGRVRVLLLSDKSQCGGDSGEFELDRDDRAHFAARQCIATVQVGELLHDADSGDDPSGPLDQLD